MTTRNSDEIVLTPKALIALILAVLGTPIAQTLYVQHRTGPQAVRPDPFTGADGRSMEDRLQRQIDQANKRIDALRSDVNLCLRLNHGGEQ